MIDWNLPLRPQLSENVPQRRYGTLVYYECVHPTIGKLQYVLPICFRLFGYDPAALGQARYLQLMERHAIEATATNYDAPTPL